MEQLPIISIIVFILSLVNLVLLLIFVKKLKKKEDKYRILRSEPIAIKVVNTSSELIKDVVLFGSNKSRTEDAPSFGNDKNITITSSIPGITYLELLAYSENNSFTVGETMVVSNATRKNEEDELEVQVEEAVTVMYKTNTGRTIQYVVCPIIDPHQFQTKRVVFSYEYIVDGFTSLTISRLYPNATVSLYFFKKEKVVEFHVKRGFKYYYMNLKFYIASLKTKKTETWGEAKDKK